MSILNGDFLIDEGKNGTETYTVFKSGKILMDLAVIIIDEDKISL